MTEKIALVELGPDGGQAMTDDEMRMLLHADFDRIIFKGRIHPRIDERIEVLRLYGIDIETVDADWTPDVDCSVVVLSAN